MEYQEFKKMIKKRMQKMMGDSVEVTIEAYYKTNQTRVESLSFKEKAPANPVAVSPAVSLKDLYDLFEQHGDGSVLEDCLRLIQELYEKQEPKAINAVMDSWDEIKGRVVNTAFSRWLLLFLTMII